MRIDEIREQAPVPQTVELTVIAQDPTVKVGKRILTAQVRVPAERLEPGPRGARFHVVDYDPAGGTLGAPAVIAPDGQDQFLGASDKDLTTDPAFRAQNAYAIAARTLASFEGALGRRLRWEFGHQLYLVPRAVPEANAYYDPDQGAVHFGYVPTADGELQTVLNHDIIAHETTHAVLDGLRPRFAEPGLPDQSAYHEALGDIVALLSVFSLRRVCERLLGEADPAGKIDRALVSPEALKKSPLFVLAEELGEGMESDRGSGLRRSVEREPGDAWRKDPAFLEPHLRGEILVAAVMRTHLVMWSERLGGLGDEAKADRARVAEEGAKAAAHLLGMMIRGIDYMPPVELEFEDVLDSVLKADEVLAPDDEHDYRGALENTFASYDIKRPPGGVLDLSDEDAPTYERMNYALLRGDPDEVFRFIWENAEVLGIDLRFRLNVESVHPSVRVGPDGLIVPEVAADYIQTLDLLAGELGGLGIEPPANLDPSTPVQLWGGGVLIFDQFGRAKWHQSKSLADPDRQKRRLAYLESRGLRDSRNWLGFAIKMPRGQRFAALHVSDRRAGEDW
jgi:hypothetical protein